MDSIKKNIIIFFCVIEIILMSPRTFSYILIDLLPIRVLSLPLITFSFIITIAEYIITELLTPSQLLKKLIKFRIVLLIWTGVFILSTVFNPLRDVVFEMQGMLIFMINVVMFSIASIHLGKKRSRLILGILFSIAGTILILNFILLTNPDLLPIGYSQDGLRYEGLYSSTPIMAIIAISSTYILLYPNRLFIFVGIIGLIAAISGLVMTATRSAMGASFLSAIVVLIYYFHKSRNMKMSIVLLLAISLLLYFIGIQFIGLYPSIEANIEYSLFRINKLNVGNYDPSRVAEIVKNIDLFFESPIFGHGFGLLNKYLIPGWGDPLFSHNFIASIISRTGILGLIIITWYGYILFQYSSIKQNLNSFYDMVIARSAFIGSLFLITISNFSGFQTFGIYGALLGIAIGATVDQPAPKKIIIINNIRKFLQKLYQYKS